LKRRPELFVSMPATTSARIHPKTMQSYLRLQLPGMKIFNMPTDVPTVSARNTSIQIAHELGAKALLFIDSDMEFQSDAYQRLQKVKGDIVCGLFYTRSAPSVPLCGFGPRSPSPTIVYL